MGTATLAVTWRRYDEQSNRLLNLCRGLDDLDVAHRKLVAEMVVVRLHLLTEDTVRVGGAKVLCGASYLDGTTAQVMVKAKSIAEAQTLMKTHGRRKPVGRLQWTKASFICDNLRYTLSASDPFFVTVRNHGPFLQELRQVRNHIVHGTESTRREFRKVIRGKYGGLKRGVDPGVLLLTDALGTPPLAERYIRLGRVFIKDLLRP